jgi:hypothetical protein
MDFLSIDEYRAWERDFEPGCGSLPSVFIAPPTNSGADRRRCHPTRNAVAALPALCYRKLTGFRFAVLRSVYATTARRDDLRKIELKFRWAIFEKLPPHSRLGRATRSHRSRQEQVYAARSFVGKV